MRVTKVIREYVEREIGAKFNPLIDDVGKEYKEEKAELERRLKDLEERTKEEAIRIGEELGFTARYKSDVVSIRTGWFENEAKSLGVMRRRAELREKRDDAIEEILLNLELGETTRAELKGAIEAVTV